MYHWWLKCHIRYKYQLTLWCIVNAAGFNSTIAFASLKELYLIVLKYLRKPYPGPFGIQALANCAHYLAETLEVLLHLCQGNLPLLFQQLLDTLVENAFVEHVQLAKFSCTGETQTR